VALALCLAGCGGADRDPSSSETAQPANGQAGEQIGEQTSVVEDLTRQWGPDDMPERVTQPLEFLYWRVDQLFATKDLDQDGRLTPDEFSAGDPLRSGSESQNFERIDTDSDGRVTKKEINDYMTQVLRAQGTIP
jgi:hypothetical protein